MDQYRVRPAVTRQALNAHHIEQFRTHKEYSMTIYRYEIVSTSNVDSVNRLLARGWKPSREVPLNDAGADRSVGLVLVILERCDTQPVTLAPRLDRDVPLEKLRDVPLLANLTHEELSELIGVAMVRDVSSGDVVFDETSSDSCLCVILEGEIELWLTAAGSSGAEIMQIGARDVFGESSFFSGGPHAAQATAVTDARLLVIPQAGYDELLQAARPAAWKLAVNAAGILGVRLQETDAWLAEILQQEEDARIAHSWQRFRESTGRGGFSARRFFGT
jgi:CRP-like cAMP-binding protein